MFLVNKEVVIYAVQTHLARDSLLGNLEWKELQLPVVQLILAAAEGDLDKAVALLGDGVDVNSRFDTTARETALMKAAQYNQAEMVQFLLDNGARPELESKSGLTALHAAATSGAIEAAEKLISWGFKPDRHLERTPDIDQPGRGLFGWSLSPLTLAAMGGHLELVQLLLTNGADPKRAVLPALHAACTADDTLMAELFLNPVTDLDARDDDGDTLLHSAARSGSLKMIKLLTDSGAQIDAVNAEHHTPLESAAGIGGKEAVSLLLELDADPLLVSEAVLAECQDRELVHLIVRAKECKSD